MRPSIVSEGQKDATAERLVEILCEIPLATWRSTALAAAFAPGGRAAAEALTAAMPSVNPVHAWMVLDDLETALFRLTAVNARDIVPSAKEYELIRIATRRAVQALLCRDYLAPEHVHALAGPFLSMTLDSACPPERSEGFL